MVSLAQQLGAIVRASDAALATHEREKVTVSSVNLYDLNLFFSSSSSSSLFSIFFILFCFFCLFLHPALLLPIDSLSFYDSPLKNYSSLYMFINIYFPFSRLFCIMHIYPCVCV